MGTDLVNCINIIWRKRSYEEQEYIDEQLASKIGQHSRIIAILENHSPLPLGYLAHRLRRTDLETSKFVITLQNKGAVTVEGDNISLRRDKFNYSD